MCIIVFISVYTLSGVFHRRIRAAFASWTVEESWSAHTLPIASVCIGNVCVLEYPHSLCRQRKSMKIPHREAFRTLLLSGINVNPCTTMLFIIMLIPLHIKQVTYSCSTTITPKDIQTWENIFNVYLGDGGKRAMKSKGN